ncbi:hypothetical protein PAHAL_4G057200 [Panicum hallii]|uniref:Uncharacterized protein n=1 Tax=Panicum hallii TaxID=206008 RepID=A0A2T8JBX6_9POAL|nr:hypothetical protein PAHAL_4G057200 [Panicum hallii]
MAGSHERGPTSCSELPADMLVTVLEGLAESPSVTSAAPDGRSYPVPRSTAPPSPGGSGRASPTAGLDARVLADYLYHRVHLARRTHRAAAAASSCSSTGRRPPHYQLYSRGRATRTGLG